MLQLTIGFILDLIIGDPNNPYHPVRIIGWLCTKLESLFRRVLKKHLKIAGLIVWTLVVSITFVSIFSILYLCKKLSPSLGVLVEGILLYFCISSKGLVVEGKKVINHLKGNNIEGARTALSYIVGRDTKNLTKEQIIKAVVETISENICDGIVAPLLYAGIFGAPLAFLYKAVNTMDSMFGYKNEKYKDFGYFPAKLDDIFNFIPARISGILIIISSYILRYDYRNSFKIFIRDRYNHTSPNSAHSEAAMAGALNIQLGGANYYFGKLVDKPTIGDKHKEIDFKKVDDTVKILYLTTFLTYLLAIVLRIVI